MKEEEIRNFIDICIMIGITIIQNFSFKTPSTAYGEEVDMKIFLWSEIVKSRKVRMDGLWEFERSFGAKE